MTSPDCRLAIRNEPSSHIVRRKIDETGVEYFRGFLENEEWNLLIVPDMSVDHYFQAFFQISFPLLKYKINNKVNMLNKDFQVLFSAIA